MVKSFDVFILGVRVPDALCEIRGWPADQNANLSWTEGSRCGAIPAGDRAHLQKESSHPQGYQTHHPRCQGVKSSIGSIAKKVLGIYNTLPLMCKICRLHQSCSIRKIVGY